MSNLFLYYNFKGVTTTSVPNASVGAETLTATLSTVSALNNVVKRTTNPSLYCPSGTLVIPTLSGLPSDGITISLWTLKTNSTLQTLFTFTDSSSNVYSIVLNAQNQFIFSKGSTSLTAGKYAINTWHHIVWILSSTWSMYIDGEWEASLSNNVNPTSIVSGTITSTTYTGYLAEIQAYKQALSADQIYAIYNKTTFLHYYRFESSDVTGITLANLASGTPIYDASFVSTADNPLASSNFGISTAKKICGTSSMYYSYKNTSGTNGGNVASNASATNCILLPPITLQTFFFSTAMWFFAPNTNPNTNMTLFTLKSKSNYNYGCYYNSSTQTLSFVRNDFSSYSINSGTSNNTLANNIGSSLQGNSLRLPIGSTSVARNTWHHVVWAITGSAWKIWIDNTATLLGPTCKNMSTLLTLPSSLTFVFDAASSLLYDASASASGFDGYIDDFRIYNRMLSDDDVNNLYKMKCILTNYYDQTGTDFIHLYSPKVSTAAGTTSYLTESNDDMGALFEINNANNNQQQIANYYFFTATAINASSYFATIEPSLAFSATGNYTVIDYGTGYYTLVFTDNGTISFSDMLSLIDVVLVGGGGAGGDAGGGGGGGGNVVQTTNVPIVPYMTYLCDIGKGGYAGENGSTTTFGNGIVVAAGGNVGSISGGGGGGGAAGGAYNAAGSSGISISL